MIFVAFRARGSEWNLQEAALRNYNDLSSWEKGRPDCVGRAVQKEFVRPLTLHISTHTSKGRKDGRTENRNCYRDGVQDMAKGGMPGENRGTCFQCARHSKTGGQNGCPGDWGGFLYRYGKSSDLYMPIPSSLATISSKQATQHLELRNHCQQPPS